MKRFFIITLIITLSNCSFDTKTGIWENSNVVNKKNIDRFKDFETLYAEEKTFNRIIKPRNNSQIYLDSAISNQNWLQENFQNSNNFINFSYNGLNEIIFKSKKLSRNNINEKFLFDGSNLIATDDKGNIIVYSVLNKKISLKYNFYKKKYKSTKKKLNIIIENEIIYVSDNIGYLYALDYSSKKIIWAKNFKIPFRSNLKSIDNQIILSDTNNVLYFINKSNGSILRNIPTEENLLKSSYINSLALDNNYLFYLNTYGSIYSININNGGINWFLNLNKSLSINPSNLFYSNPLLLDSDKIIISSDPNLYVFNKKNGVMQKKLSITSINKPVISNQKIFIITKDNLLVCLDLSSDKILYSINIANEIASFLKTKAKSVQIKNFLVANSKILIFLNNSYLVEISSNGIIKKVDKLPAKLNSNPIFSNDSMMYIDKSNKLIILN